MACNRKLSRFLPVCAALLVLCAAPATAVIGTIDDVPASTLLLPYFEVDLDDANGITTLFSINNASASATLAHVTVWSTWSIPVIDFDVYLTGFDVQTFNLRDVLTGKQSSVNGTCAGANYGDNIARGYVTVDVTNACSQLFPSDAGYFVSGGGGIAGNRNILWGDYFYVNPGQNFAQGETLVGSEADATSLSTPGEYTFYGRYLAGAASDNREPLATSFAVRYLTGGGFTGGTDLIVWRDSKFPPGASCATGPNYGELFEQQIVVFDELENPLTVTTGGPSGEPTPGAQCTFCDEAQRVEVGGAGIATNADFGWLYLNLNHATTVDAALGPGYILIAQAWVTAVMDAEGRFSVGFDAIQLDNANTAVTGGVILPVNVVPQ